MATVRPAGGRFATRGQGRASRHAFSFGAHYAPDRIAFGVLVACNEDWLEPGAGYDPHEHRDVEIVSWVLEGTLLHDDSSGPQVEVTPGRVQALSAGRGISHAERAGAAPVHLLQMWVTTDSPGLAPAYATADVSPALRAGGWVPLASGRADDGAALALRQRQACLRVARLGPGDSLPLPAAPRAYLHVARGQVLVDGCGRLATGDAALLVAGAGAQVAAAEAAEVLVWELGAH